MFRRPPPESWPAFGHLDVIKHGQYSGVWFAVNSSSLATLGNDNNYYGGSDDDDDDNNDYGRTQMFGEEIIWTPQDGSFIMTSFIIHYVQQTLLE